MFHRYPFQDTGETLVGAAAPNPGLAVDQSNTPSAWLFAPFGRSFLRFAQLFKVRF